MNRRNPVEVEAGTQERKKRTPVGMRNKLTVDGKDPNFVYRIVNDAPGRIDDFKDAGWEICSASEVRVGDRRVNETTPEGALAEVNVNSGDGARAYVMKVKREWAEEDLAERERINVQAEEALRPNASNGHYGKLETKVEIK